MIASEILSGQNTSWSLLDRLGEGDAGEVFRAEPLLGGQTGIVKRPRRSAFHGEVIRQANQIRAEGQVLEMLAGLLAAGEVPGVAVPRLLDTSKPGSEYSDRQFIVIDEAPGFDLAALMRAARFGLTGLEGLLERLAPGEARLLASVAESGKLPERVILSALAALLDLLPRLHSHAFVIDDVAYAGLIWNDVKAEHIFWNPGEQVFTIIDWGNVQFLDADGTTRDRRGSRLDDWRQLVEELGRFLNNAAPELHTRLNWPSLMTPGALADDTFQSLSMRVTELLLTENSMLRQARVHQDQLLADGITSPETLAELDQLHNLLLSLGEVPDFAGARRLAAARAVQLIRADQLGELGPLSEWAARLPAEEPGPWELVSRLSALKSSPLLVDSLQAALSEDTHTVIWNLAVSLSGREEPPWWYDLTDELRRLILGPAAPALRPLTAANRLLLGLQALVRQAAPDDPALAHIREAARRLREEILPAWTQSEPAPPHSTLLYSDIDALVSLLSGDAPEPPDLPDLTALLHTLSGPRAAVSEVLAAWELQDFEQAQNGLRGLLAWDPERRRVLRAAASVASAADWLRRAQAGPERGSGLAALVTDLEFEGRELRNSVGPAGWIDTVLAGLRQLRRGVWPADLLGERPALADALPWLARYRRPPALPENGENIRPAALKGMKQSALGPGGELCLLGPLDAWTAEARGSSARVFLGSLPGENGAPARAALKLMRPDKAGYALPLFREEAVILSILKDIPGVVPLLECGFIQIGGLEAEAPLPSGEDVHALNGLSGPVLRIGAESTQIFLNLLEARCADGWVPYVALPVHPHEENLIHLVDAGRTAGRFQPVPDLIQMSIQILDIMETAHQRGIVYRDHKILHYYWKTGPAVIDILDWNVARYHPEGLPQIEKNMDMVQFGARGLHHILTGRSAPGALPLGPTRPEEIEAAAMTYETQWTYDDRRLSEEIKSIIEAVLAGAYSSAAALRDDLKNAYMRL